MIGTYSLLNCVSFLGFQFVLLKIQCQWQWKMISKMYSFKIRFDYYRIDMLMVIQTKLSTAMQLNILAAIEVINSSLNIDDYNRSAYNIQLPRCYNR